MCCRIIHCIITSASLSGIIRKGTHELYRRGCCFFILIYYKPFRLKERDIFKSSPLGIKLDGEHTERDAFFRDLPEFCGSLSRI